MNADAHSPYSRDDLISSLEDVHREVGVYFAELPGDALFRHPEAGVWSPAENLVHLVKAVKAVADAMGRPRWLLAILFGTARGPSRPFEEMRRVYQERLARGGRAGGDDVDLRVARPPRPVLPTRRRPVTTTSSRDPSRAASPGLPALVPDRRTSLRSKVENGSPRLV
ncbi:MAG TPA: hypothetical protein VGG06_12640 [Thermoanaerobaculia bacterium]|jgi:hypothetical protein